MTFDEHTLAEANRLMVFGKPIDECTVDELKVALLVQTQASGQHRQYTDFLEAQVGSTSGASLQPSMGVGSGVRNEPC